MMIFIFVLGVLLLIWTWFMLVRNEAVYRVRINFIDADDFPRSYGRLPSYRQMMGSKYWLLWTTEHWLAWMNRQESLNGPTDS